MGKNGRDIDLEKGERGGRERGRGAPEGSENNMNRQQTPTSMRIKKGSRLISLPFLSHAREL